MLFILGDCAFLAYRNEGAIAKSQSSGSLAGNREQEGSSRIQKRLAEEQLSLLPRLRLFFQCE